MGFWHTGYGEHHEGSDLESVFEPTQAKFPCEFCQQIFRSRDALAIHLLEIHPVKKPKLYILGFEVGSVLFRVVSPIFESDIRLDTNNYTKIEVNGKELTYKEFLNTLETTRKDTLSIKVFTYQQIFSQFKIEFEIADAKDLNGIDDCLLKVFEKRKLDRNVIDDFIEKSKGYHSALRYLDGFCQYFYAVLAKEGNEKSFISITDSEQRFNQALKVLADYKRPYAQCVRSLIEFNFNHFSECYELGIDSRVSIVSKRFANWCNGGVDFKSSGADLIPQVGFEGIFTDNHTELLLRYSLMDYDELLVKTKELELIIASNITKYDHAKYCILLVEIYMSKGDLAGARHYVQSLRYLSDFEKWVESVRIRLGGWNR